MINQASVVESLQELAEKVRSSDPNAAGRLMLLSNAVESGANAEAWTYADIHALIAPESIVERYRSESRKMSRGLDSLIFWLELTRNTLIFAPIIVTWYGISQATDKYNILISAAIQAKKLELYSQPFLYLWQQRFGGLLPEYLTLTNIAIVDVIILLIILVFTFLAYLLSSMSTSAREKDARLLRSNLIHALAGAVLSLHARPKLTASDNLEQVARQLDSMIRLISGRFDTMTQNITGRLQQMAQDTTTSLQQMAQNATNSMDRLAQNNASSFDKLARETTGRFETMTKNLTGQYTSTIQQTKAQLDQIAQEMNRQVQAGSKYLIEMNALTTGVAQLASQIQSSSSSLQSASATLANGVQRLIMPAEKLTQQQQNLLDAVQQSVALLQGTSTSISDLVTRQQKMAAELTDVLDTLALSVEKFDTLGTEQANLVNQHATFLQHLQDEHDKQTQLAILMSDATIGVKNALSEMNHGAISLRSMAVDMNDLVRLQAAVSSNPAASAAMDISAILQSYTSAAQTMEVSGNSLKASAFALQRASQQLRDVLDTLQSTQNGHH
jgi:hypothetical protein